MTKEQIIIELIKFAEKHKIALETKGECGFGRPCVGFTSGNGYVDFNPIDMVNYMPIEELQCDKIYPPDGVDNYHKHDCLAVLVEDEDYEEGLRQLLSWVKHIEAQGSVEVKQYKTGATGLQAMVSGSFGTAIIVK
jgi:hypothetical protein